MAVLVNQPHPSRRAQLVLVTIDRPHRIAELKVQSTASTSALLCLQEPCDSLGHFGVRACSRAPVDCITIEGAAVPLHFGVPPNGNVRHPEECRLLIRSKRPAVLAEQPVLSGNPVAAFVGVTATCPSPELSIDEHIHLIENLLRNDRGEVISPTSNDRVEHPDHRHLGDGRVATDFIPDLSKESFLGFCAWPDRGREARPAHRACCARTDSPLACIDENGIRGSRTPLNRPPLRGYE